MLIDATAMTLGQGHGKVIQYISPDPYIICAKYQRFSSNGFDVKGKSFLRWRTRRKQTENIQVTPDPGDPQGGDLISVHTKFELDCVNTFFR